MKTNPTRSCSWAPTLPALRCLLALTALLVMLPARPVAAFSPVITKIHAKNSTPQFVPQFGKVVAVSDKWILVGEPSNSDDGPDPDVLADTNSGAVHVFNAVTGAYVRKLRALDASVSDLFGGAVAVSGDLALVGAINAPGFAPGSSGAAYVFNLLTGVQVKRLVASDGAVNSSFGSSVALSGNRALVGDEEGPGLNATTGSAYVFDITLPGAQLTEIAELNAGDGINGHQFGDSVALSGNLALVGARSANGAAAGSGAAYLFDITAPATLATPTGTAIPHLTKLQAAGGLSSENFGQSVALSGRRALVGADGVDVPAPNVGAAYLFDITAPGAFINELFELSANDAADGDRFGRRVALSGHLALVGAPEDDDAGNLSGSAYVFDALTGAQLGKLSAPDGTSSHSFGASAALAGNLAVLGAPADGDLGIGFGAAYIFRPLAGLFPMKKVAANKDFAPDAPQTSFSTFSDAFINEESEILLPAVLVGTGATLGRNRGVWTTLAANQSLDLALRSGLDMDPGVAVLSATGMSNPIVNQPGFGIFQATLAGTGVTVLNNRAIFGDDGLAVTQLLRLNDTKAGLVGGTVKVAQFLQVVQSTSAADGQAVVYRLARAPLPNLVTASSDTGILSLENDGDVSDFVREGGPTGLLGGPTYGQFSRAAFHGNTVFFLCGLQGGAPPVTAADNQALFVMSVGGADAGVARKGTTASGLPVGVVFSTFLGETVEPNLTQGLIRATVSGAGVTTANNEVLWKSEPTNLVAREGAPPVPNLAPGQVWSTFLNYWVLPASLDQVLFTARIRGPGVTTANDVGLWLKQEDDNFLLLLREGDPAPDCFPARIGTIQRVAVDSANGNYAVLATLTNASTATNQAIFTGNTLIPDTVARKELRKPFCVLRKGTLYQKPLGGTTTIKSLSLPASAFDATGAGAKGLGQPISALGELVLPIVFTDLSTEIMTGRP